MRREGGFLRGSRQLVVGGTVLTILTGVMASRWGGGGGLSESKVSNLPFEIGTLCICQL